MDRTRPAGLFLIAAFEVGLAGVAALELSGRSVPFVTGVVPTLLESSEGRAALVVIAITLVLSAAGMVTGRRWGWALAMVLVGLSLCAALAAWWGGHFRAVTMAIGIAAAFYLNQTAVREYFDRGPRRAPTQPPG
jgi:hypothetical protein